MPIEFASFAFIITLAAVVNGLGIVRWLTSLSEFLRHRKALRIKPYWVFILFAGFQFLMHVLMWWSLWSVRGAGEINFLVYVYLLTGPILLFLGTSVLVPDFSQDTIDMRAHYFEARKTYSGVLTLLWIWAVFLSPVLRGAFAPTVPVFSAFVATAVIQRLVSAPSIQATIVALNWLLLVLFVGLHAMQLGGTGT